MKIEVDKKHIKLIILLIIFSTSVIVSGLIFDDPTVTVISSVVAIVYLLLLGESIRWAYFFGLVYGVMFAFVTFIAALYATAVFSAFIMSPVCIYRFLTSNKEKNRQIKSLSLRNWLYTAAGILFLFAGLYFILRAVGDSQPVLDSVNFSLSIITMALLLLNYKEMWFTNQAVSTITIAIWIVQAVRGNNGISVIVLHIIISIINIVGIINWKKILNRNKAKTAIYAEPANTGE